MIRRMVRMTLAMAAGLTVGLGAVAATAQTSSGAEPRTIRVTGVGEATAEPDLATVQFAVETTGLTAQEAGQRNAESMERVIRALIAAGVTRDDIQTSSYSLYPEYAEQSGPVSDNQPPRIRGYRATNEVAVRTADLESVGRLIDFGLEAGANRMHGVSFELRNSQAAESEALQRAVEEGRRAAETIARTLGVQLGAVLDASTSAQLPQPMYRMAGREAAMSMDALSLTPIEAGEQTVRAVASLVFAIQ